MSPPASPAPRSGGAAIRLAFDRATGAGDVGGGDAAPPVDNVRLAKLELNDVGNGERFMARYGRDALFVREVGWHHWDGKRWARAGADQAVRRMAHATARGILEEVDAVSHLMNRGGWPNEDGDPVALMQRLFGWATDSGDSGRLNGMLKEAAPYMTIDPTEMDADPRELNLGNGTLRLEGGCDTLRPHARDDRLAKVIPVDFDPDAPCPDFEAFLAKVQPDAAIRDFLQRWAGYLLTGETGEQVMVFNFGTGANGKSVFAELLGRVLGPYAKSLPFASLIHQDRARGDAATPDLARLPGARMVRASEPEKGARFAESLIKQLTGGEPMTVRHLNHGFFEFTPQFKLMISGNHKPKITGQDHGIWRRMLLVPWSVTIPDEEQVDGLADLLWEKEAAGILNWMLEGCQMWLKGRLCVPAAVRAFTNEYKQESDPLGRFCEAMLERVEAGDWGEVPAGQMYDAWKAWCAASGERPWGQTAFGRGLSERGWEKERRGGAIYYTGVRLKEMVADPADRDGPPDVRPEDFG